METKITFKRHIDLVMDKVPGEVRYGEAHGAMVMGVRGVPLEGGNVGIQTSFYTLLRPEIAVAALKEVLARVEADIAAAAAKAGA